LELWPASASAPNYLLSTLVGKPDLNREPREYIVESFDAFADGFDAKLVDVLGYDVLQQLTSLVRDATTPGRLSETLDAGCGSGLCGPWLRPMARTLTGVDLSSRMLEHAEKRSIYNAVAPTVPRHTA
jgi:predicted TPR repeat methyltransferase